jgi:hypothetical protein
MSILIPEDGTGLLDSNTYQTVAQAVDRLDKLGYSALGDLGDPNLQERYLVRGTLLLDQGIKANPKGNPLVTTQALYGPRVWPETWTLDAIPENLILASALRAEIITLESAGKSAFYASIPDNVTEVKLSEDVSVKKKHGKISARGVAEIQSLIFDLIGSISSNPDKNQLRASRRVFCS